jgi:hypothetical protein
MSNQNDGAWRAGMEAETRDLRRSVDVLFGKVDAQSGKLDAISTALHEIRGAAGPSLKDVVIIVTALTGLFASVAGGILWLARGGNAEDLRKIDEARHQLELRMVRVETALASVRLRPAPGAWVPDSASP